ncbi:LytR/AlgR family response regulator transcription factor [Mucilaginibacter flavidus]|uniref:LytR/AlgR family response regulator transcription factor n=1 Tax=Mucilaginibacter flavidus TaxID=2949309 RepID=UPI002092C469|nr:response regulator transcription factor [Mucilaginibacter flavidus]MCO5947999.1 response regulator transcription factor [Mucilaginibacter flavidus]
MTLNCIAIDDEPPALDLLCRFIDQTPYLKLTGSFSNAVESLHFINESKVDLIFLDIQMPDLSGIELARILSGRNTGNAAFIVFTTAFDQFALEGYKLDAIDYLLKPIGYNDFLKAVQKVVKWAELRRNRNELLPQNEDFIYLKVEFQTVKIRCSDIIYIEGFKDYAKIFLTSSEKSMLSLITLKALQENLPKGKFMRIHKSFIVSLDKITAVTKNSVLIGSSSFPVSEPFKDGFNQFVKTWQ